MRPEHRLQVELHDHVAIEDEDLIVELVRDGFDRAGRAERRLFPVVVDADPEGGAVAEVGLKHLRPPAGEDEDVLETMSAGQFDLVGDDRLAGNLEHRLRQHICERAHSRALAAGQDDHLHARFALPSPQSGLR